MPRRLRLGWLALWLAALQPLAGQAAVRALVVGVDDYRHLPPLAGAVNDARDLARSLGAIAGSEVTLLLDREASRDAIRAGWRAMLARAQSGDTLVFSYAGHGSRVPELVRGSEADGLDDVFVLADYDPMLGDAAALIRDDELFDWFQAAEGRGVQVLFVADSCHSGTMTRAADSRLGAARTRLVELDLAAGLAEDSNVRLAAPAPALTQADLPYLTFLSAGLESQQIPEVTVETARGGRQTRGALSFAVARALEGEADADGDRLLTRAELRGYVVENVQVLSERQQTPALRPRAQPSQPVLALSADAPPPRPLPPAAPVAVFVDGLDAAGQLALARAIPALRWVRSIDRAQLYWDLPRGELLSREGDLLLRGLGDAGPVSRARLRGVLDKRAALARLHRLSRPRVLKSALAPDARRHRLGEQIEVSFYGQRGEYLLVFNLAGDGTLQLLYPLARHGDPLRHGRRRWSLPLAVGEPLGADHLVALAFAEPQPDLLQSLQALDGRRAAAQLLALLEPALARRAVEVGIVGMFSAPAPIK